MTDLEALAKLASEATPGPWATVRYWPRHIAPAQDRKKSLGGSTDPVEDRKRFVHPILEVRLDEHFPGCEEFHEGRQHDPDQAEATAALIVAAVNALPALVRGAQRLRPPGGYDQVRYLRGRRRGHGPDIPQVFVLDVHPVGYNLVVARRRLEES